MHYSKFLILVTSLITLQYSYAACTGSNCFNDGIDFAKQVPSSIVSNSIIESAVGKEKFTEAVTTKDNLANQMGGEFRNVDKMSNAGNQKLQNCVGKTSYECNAVSYYNDPLMRQKQQGIESAVGIASYLLNKQIQQDVDFTAYCKRNPNDSMCKMCKDNPNQSMCQNGNKCTTITYQTTDGSQKSFSCEIVGQREYHCNKWIDNVDYHIDQPFPADGTVMASGLLQASLKPYSYINNAATLTADLTITVFNDLTKQNLLKLTGTVSSYPNSNCGTDSKPINLNVSFSQTQSIIYSLNYPSGFRCQTEGGSNLLISGGCTGDACTYLFTAIINGHYSGVNKDQTETKTMTFSFAKPKVGSNEIIVENVTWKDNCTK